MPRICAIHQPNFFPWLGYFHKIASSDVFVILNTVDIETGTANAITNRTRIKTSAGVQWMTMPIRKGDSKIIKDICIDNRKKWRETMLKTIYYQYRKAPYFETFYPFFESIIKYESDNMSEYNTHIITKMCEYFGIDTKFVRSSELPELSDDRNMRLIDICKSLDCDTYLSGNGGRKYHNEQMFSDNGITVKYTNFVHPTYNQLYGPFEIGLSSLDYCFNCCNKLWK